MTWTLSRRVRARPALVAMLLMGLAVSAYLGLGFDANATRPAPMDTDALYAAPLLQPTAPLRVFHLGHSLVGRDMPAMVQQLADPGHAYDAQLGWGTPLRAHWDPEITINGFDRENGHERYRDAMEAVESGDYDAVVLTEMVEIRDAIDYHGSADYLARWAAAAHLTRPDARIYLYETWPRIDDAEGWLSRLELDLAKHWEGAVLFPALVQNNAEPMIHVIPGGQVLAQFIRAVENRDGVDGLSGKEDLFAKDDAGQQDPIHLNDIGNYLIALTHFAVLYHASPVGLPHALNKADGHPAIAPSEDAARLMQDVVWQVVTSYPKTGVLQASAR